MVPAARAVVVRFRVFVVSVVRPLVSPSVPPAPAGFNVDNAFDEMVELP